jgi:serine/threonine protein kinase
MDEPPDLLGQLAISSGYIDAETLRQCLQLQKQYAENGTPALIGEIFVSRGHLDGLAVQILLDKQTMMRGRASAATDADGGGMEDLTYVDPQLWKARIAEIAQDAKRASAEEGTLKQAAVGAVLKRLGPFILERCVSKGGMGTVYLARKDREERRVALKILEPLAATSDELLVRFKREARFLLSLDHPNIVAAYEVGTEEGKHYLSMEFVDGEDLGTMIGRDGALDPVAAFGIMRQVAQALSYAEGRGIVHRDVKPQNVLISGDGAVKLADMGLAILANREDLRLTAPGRLVGTPAYMSPEHIGARRDIDIRSDIYALGCTIYHAVCGRPPFVGQIIVVSQQQRNDPPPRPTEFRPDLPAQPQAILMKCLEKDPAARYQTCAELIDEVSGYLEKSAGGTTPGAGQAAPERPPRRKTKVEEQFGFGEFDSNPRRPR